MSEIVLEQVYEELHGLRLEVAALREAVQSIAARLGDSTKSRPVYRLLVKLDSDEAGGYVVTSNALPELVTEGNNQEAALRNAKEAVEDLLEVMQEDGDELPLSLRGYCPGDMLEIVAATPEAE